MKKEMLTTFLLIVSVVTLIQCREFFLKVHPIANVGDNQNHQAKISIDDSNIDGTQSSPLTEETDKKPIIFEEGNLSLVEGMLENIIVDGEEGSCRVVFSLSTTGSVTEIEILQCFPDTLFSHAGRTVLKWRFEASEKNHIGEKYQVDVSFYKEKITNEAEESINIELNRLADQDNTPELEKNTCPISVCPDDFSSLKTKYIGINNASSLKVRQGPSENYQKVYSLKNQEVVDVLAVDSGWLFVKRTQYDLSSYGWVAESFIRDKEEHDKKIKSARSRRRPSLQQHTPQQRYRLVKEYADTDVFYEMDDIKNGSVPDYGQVINIIQVVHLKNDNLFSTGSNIFCILTIKINGITTSETLMSVTIIPSSFTGFGQVSLPFKKRNNEETLTTSHKCYKEVQEVYWE